jgi:hypothetical protein
LSAQVARRKVMTTIMTAMSEAYLHKHAPDLDLQELDVKLTEIALWFAKTGKVETSSLSNLTRRLLRSVEDEVYVATLRAAPQNFIGGDAPWPQLRTSVDPHALHEPPATTIKMRNDTLLAIYRRWASEMNCDKDICDPAEGFNHWLPHVDFIAEIAMTKPDGTPKQKNTMRIALKCLRALCEATQQHDLRKQYEERLLPHCLESEDDEDTRKRVTPEQMEEFYAELDRMHKKAMLAVSKKDLKPCLDYLILALHWGDGPGLLQPQRNDMRSFRFLGPNTRRDKDNYFLTSLTTATLTINTRHKTHKQLNLALAKNIDLTENKNLVEFLVAYRPFAQELQPNTTEPFLLCSRMGQPMSSSNLSTRIHYIWKSNLEPKLGFNAAGCNVARRAAVDTARRKHGKRKLTPTEIKEEKRQCAERGHTRTTADNRY